MPRPPGGYSPELAEVMNTILGDLSQEAASRRAEGALSTLTFGRLRHGKRVLPQTLFTVARYWEKELCGHFGDRIRTAYGTCDAETAGEWLCDLTTRVPSRPRTGEEAPAGIVDVRQYSGAEDLEPHELATLNEIVQAYIRGVRSAREAK